MTAIRRFGKPVAALALAGLVLQAVSWCCVPTAMAAQAAATGEHCHSGAEMKAAHSPSQAVASVSCESRPDCCSGAVVAAVIPGPADSVVYASQPAGLPSPVGGILRSVDERAPSSPFTRFDYQSPPRYLSYCTFLE